MSKQITTEDRLKATEILVSGDYGMDAEWYSHFEKKTKALSRKKLYEEGIEDAIKFLVKEDAIDEFFDYKVIAEHIKRNLQEK